ncbi:MAG: phosphoribosylanthranilate isomerase [Gemmatimonadetes bacterium]|nr:phosphoribosylanthranilate isomerase [Gemmatimonadota bacterium]
MDHIAKLATLVPASVESFLLSSQVTLEGIVAEHAVAGTTTLQLVDAVPHEVLRALRDARPGVRLVQVIHVTGAAAVEEALAVAPLVDALLLDSGNPQAAVKELGGTGRVHDWTFSREIVRQSGRPVYLAGGMRPDNVRAAMDAVGPHGIDVCTGVRSNGALDPDKLAAMVQALGVPPAPATSR